MYLTDIFSHLLRCEVALHFVNTWDISVLTFDYHWKQLQLPVWIDYQALYLQHFMPIDYKSHIELFRNWSFHEFYHLKALITSEQVITSVVEKKTNLYQQNFEVYIYLKTRIEDWGLRIGIGDQGSVIPEKGRKIRILLLLYKKFDPNNQFLYFIDHFPLLFETLYVLLIVVNPSFSLFLMSFCFVTVVSLQSRVKQQISCWCRELSLLWRVTQRKANKNVSFTLHPSWQLFFIVVNDWFRDV